MRLKYWGTRGSCATPGAQTKEFGGNTPCVTVELPDKKTLLVLDLGTGSRALGLDLQKNGEKYGYELHIFLSHVHWDHIQGFPFFLPAYLPNWKIHFYGVGDIKSFLKGQMRPPYFPVTMEVMNSNMSFVEMPKDGVQVGDARITHTLLRHPNNSYAYRVDCGGKSMVYATDTEHPPDSTDENLIKFVKGADHLIYDGQYTEDEYKNGKVGWGHSTWMQGVNICKMAEVKFLALFSHDPTHSDDFLTKLEAETRVAWPNSHFAREGTEVDL